MSERNVYDVLNDVQADENEMEFTEAEARAYIKRFRAGRTHRHGVTWRVCAACVAGALALSGTVAYAQSVGALDWLFDKYKSESGVYVDEKYVDSEYKSSGYEGTVSVDSDLADLMEFEVKKVTVCDDVVNVVLLTTCKDWDSSRYEEFSFHMMLMDGDGDKIIGTGYTGSSLSGSEGGLMGNQRLDDIIFYLDDGQSCEAGDEVTIHCYEPVLLMTPDKQSSVIKTITVSGCWDVKVQLESGMKKRAVIVEDSDTVSSISLYTRLVRIEGSAWQGFSDNDIPETALEMEDGTMLKCSMGSGAYYDYAKYEEEIEFVEPIDVSQVVAVWVGSERFPTE